MPRQGTPLNAAQVRRVKEPGKYYDTNGLFLVVKPTGSRSWMQRLTVHGRRRDMGLGPFPLVSLAEAREVAARNRKLAMAGGDPIALRNERAVPTFHEAAETVIELHAANWRNPKSAAGWRSTLERYAYPRIGTMRVDQVQPADVMRVLLPEWNARRETMRKVRQRIGAVMKWAVAQGFRNDNPAGDAIGAALPKTKRTTSHQKALPHSHVSEAVAKVRDSGALKTTILAFEFLVLTACRSREVREATWSEVDFDAQTWTVPGDRTKTGKEHVVPLSDRASDVLKEAAELRQNDLVFPSMTGRPPTDSTISKLVRENGIEAVPHGFRSTFRDWCGERTSAPRELAEAALGHQVGNAVEQAYARSGLLDKRRVLMQQWADYIGGKHAAKVVELRQGA